jgi:hypothetical protein
VNGVELRNVYGNYPDPPPALKAAQEKMRQRHSQKRSRVQRSVYKRKPAPKPPWTDCTRTSVTFLLRNIATHHCQNIAAVACLNWAADELDKMGPPNEKVVFAKDYAKEKSA